MSDNELASIVSQLDSLHSKHKVSSYIGLGLVLLVLLFAGIGGYMLLGKFEDQAATNQKLAATQQQITEKLEKIDANNQAIIDIRKEIQDIKTQQQITVAKYDILLAQAGKQLPQPQQDAFFTSRGFVPSYYQADGGRLFGSQATVKLQTTIVEGEKCEELSVQKDAEIVKKDSLIETYQKQVTEYQGVDGLRQEEFKIVNTELKKTQKELRKEKIKKWVWTCLGISAAGYVGYQAGHN